MRQLNLYCVFDVKANTIIGPIVHDHSEVPIVRQLTEAVNKPGNMIANNPEDFYILHLGTVNEATAEVEGLKEPQVVTRAVALRAATT